MAQFSGRSAEGGREDPELQPDMEPACRFPVEQQQDRGLHLRSPWTLVSSICRFRATDVGLYLSWTLN